MNWEVSMTVATRLCLCNTICISSSHETERNVHSDRVAPVRDRLRILPPSNGTTECFGGEGVIYTPLEKMRTQNVQKTTRENIEDMFHEANMIANLGNGDIEGVTVQSGKESLLNKEPKDVLSFCFGESRVILNDILEGLISLDESGFCSSPMDDSFGSKQSDIERQPRIFSILRKKIESQEYLSWKSFVDDFELICHDAMSYYQKDSVLWKAVNGILHQGSAYLDQNAAKANRLFSCLTKADEQNGAQDLEVSINGSASLGNAVALEMEQNNSKQDKEIPCFGLLRKAYMQPEIKKAVQQVDTHGNLCVLAHECPLGHRFSNLATESLGCIQESEKNCASTDIGLEMIEVDDTVVDIIEPECIGDDEIIDSYEQATESSSSFGETDAENYETSGSVESESEMHNGNSTATVQEDCDGVSIKRKKNALSDDWKSYRRDIEWRCHWLESRIKEFQSRASKYDRILKGIQSKKLGRYQLHSTKDSTVRATPLICYPTRQHILHRKPKKVRNEGDLLTYVSKHPLFSLYENRTEADVKLAEDDPNNLRVICDHISRTSDVSNFNLHLGKAGVLDGENTAQLMLWNIDNLQWRIIKMRNRLKKFFLRKPGRISTNSMTHNSLSIQSPKGTVQGPVFTSSCKSRIQMHLGGCKVQMGSVARRRISDFDINNVIMPGNSMIAYVEPARHECIETPSWCLVGHTTKLDQKDTESSEEATDDEVYIERHRDMEIKENYLCNTPNPGKKIQASDSRFGLGIMPRSTQTRAKTDKEIYISAQGSKLRSPSYCLPWDVFVPKGKRNRQWRRPRSS